jgi:diguanylate cyclase (GGDEF)-like protein
MATTRSILTGRLVGPGRSKADTKRAVWSLTTGVSIVAAALAARLADLDPLLPINAVAWWILIPAFYVAELAVVHVRFKRDAHSFSMSELPLVLGLFFLSPLALLAAQLVGNLLVLSVHRKQPLIKLAFNLAQFSLVTVVSVIIFRALVAAADPMGPMAWLATVAATLAGLLIGDLLINTAIRLTGGSLTRREMFEVLGLSALGTVMNTSLALVGVILFVRSPITLPLILLPPAILFIAYKAYVTQRQERGRLTSLYKASRDLHRSPEIEAALQAAANHARTLLDGEFAEVVLFPADSRASAFRTIVGPGSRIELMQSVAVNRGRLLWAHALRRGHSELVTDSIMLSPGPDAPETISEAVVVPLREGERMSGVMLVANPLSDVTGFDDADLELLETLAGQLSVSLKNGRLEDSLRQLTVLKEELRAQALFDALTGLANRVLFLERVQHALQRMRRDDDPVSVLFLDLDDFKTVNDSLGHSVGDQLLVAIADRLVAACRPGDTVARLGGDEFAILLEGMRSPDEATVVAERITADLTTPLDVGGSLITMRCSIGIALGSEGDPPDDLLRNADAAMYVAKRDGKGGFRVFEDNMHAATLERFQLRNELREAIANEEFVLHYQPIRDLHTSEITGIEALIRWNHPRLGFVPPEHFIGFAEETGLIVQIGRWALGEACREAGAWEHVTLSVNLSPRQLQDGGVVESVAAALQDTGFDPKRLVLEITENVLMQASLETLDELKALGVSLAIDDFGTGYSSLSYLDRLPIDVLKIDKTFVDRLGSKVGESPLVHAVLQLGHTLGLDTIVEGIETLHQLNRLKELGCSRGQGFYLGRPMPAAEIGSLLGSAPTEAVPAAQDTAVSTSRRLRVVG